MNFPYIEGGLLGRREHEPEVDEYFTGEKTVGSGEDSRSSGLVVLSPAPSPPEKFVRFVLVLLLLSQTTTGGGVVAPAGLPFSE